MNTTAAVKIYINGVNGVVSRGINRYVSCRMNSDRTPPPQTINKPNLLRHGFQNLKLTFFKYFIFFFL